MNHQLIIRYKAGDPGGEWSTEEVKITRRQIRMMITADLYFSFKFLRSNQIKSNQVEITRRRIRMMITPDWSVKRAMGLAKSVLGGNPQDNTTPPTENLLMRLAFHDCIPYQGGKISGGKGWLLY